MAEKDFLSLKLTNSIEEDVKEVTVEDTVYMKGSGMQWPFSNKVSALPQFMPYKSLQEERSKKILFDPVASSAAAMPVSTGDAFDSNHKTYYGVQAKSFGVDRQGGPNYAMTTFPIQHVDATTTYPGHRAPDTFYMNNPYFKTHVSTSRHNFSPTMRQQSFGGTMIPSQHSYIPNAGSMAGIIDTRIAPKPTGPPTQLTIFYGGSVTVYDDISPEKAQAIMFMAGNGSAVNANMTSNMTSPRNQVQVSNSRPAGGDTCQKQSVTTSHCSGLSSPISVTSHANVQSGSGSNGIDDSIAVKPIVEVTAPSSQQELRKSPTPIGSAPAPMMPAAVPQARKASLARFLEKRKERVMNATPYKSNSMDKSMNLSEKIGSGSPPTSKELSWNLRFTTNNSNSEHVHTKLEM